jgi:uncharacterized membrane protein YphA (DoxX/SURF4 family)
MNMALWILQGILAAMYLMVGGMKTFKPAKAQEQLSWAKNRSEAFIRFVGISELSGAVGVVLPMLAGILAWLTPLAAVGLSLVQLLAIFTEHIPKKEYKVLPMNILLLTMAVLVAVGRWSIFA